MNASIKSEGEIIPASEKFSHPEINHLMEGMAFLDDTEMFEYNDLLEELALSAQKAAGKESSES